MANGLINAGRCRAAAAAALVLVAFVVAVAGDSGRRGGGSTGLSAVDEAATVSFFSFWSHTCDPYGWKIWTAGAASSATRWDNQPALIAEEAESTLTTGYTDCADAWVSIDGTSFFQRAASAGSGQAHMALTATDESNVKGFKQFRSRDANNSAEVPKASVTYNGWPTITGRATVPSTACLTGSDRPLVNTLTPTLKATAADSDDAALSVTFEWWLVGGGAPVGSATVSGIAPGATAAVTVPAGAWTDGGSYRWRATASDGVAGSATWSSFCEMTVYVTAPPVSGCAAGSAAVSDFNGDGVSDVAIADPEATVGGAEKAGALRISYGGTGTSPTAGTVQTVTGASAKLTAGSQAGAQFGFSLASADINRDGCTDLVVGAPYTDVVGTTDAGAAYLLLGAPGGLTTGPAAVGWSQGSGPVPETVEAQDWFGYAVAAGQTEAGEGYAVIGAPGEDVGSAVDTGVVHYLRGSVNVVVDQNITGSTDANETDDRFGASVSGSPGHIAAGRPGEEVNGAPFAGAVSVYRHVLSGGLPTRVADLRQGTGDVETSEAGDLMGTSVSLAPYRSADTAAGESVLLVGAPGENVASGPATVGGVQAAGRPVHDPYRR